MSSSLTDFAARLLELIRHQSSAPGFGVQPSGCCCSVSKPAEAWISNATCDSFDSLALDLFALQYAANVPYRELCDARQATPATVAHWTHIPAVPAAAFKELELSCLPTRARTAVFHSSGTTGQMPSRHFHSPESLAVYEASLMQWFRAHVLGDSQPPIANRQVPSGSNVSSGPLPIGDWRLVILTPNPAAAPHSSLVHMFETVRRELVAPASSFVGQSGRDNSWTLDSGRTLAALREAVQTQRPALLLGTAFSFVHLLDFLVDRDLAFGLPPGSRVMETGGYKGRSRQLPKTELQGLITQRLGIPAPQIVCEYGMSELSSQAYDSAVRNPTFDGRTPASVLRPWGSAIVPSERLFHFPPWARARVVSPETGRDVAEGDSGLLRIVDLANVFSVMGIQTEDLAVRRGAGFELIGRAALAEPRGCSLAAEALSLEPR